MDDNSHTTPFKAPPIVASPRLSSLSRPEISMSGHRGRGADMPNNVIDSIVDTDPVPVTISALRSVKNVGKVLIEKNGKSLVLICKQYVTDLAKWESDKVSTFPNDDLVLSNRITANNHKILFNLTTFLSFLRPSLGSVKDLYYATCKQALNQYNIVGNIADNNVPIHPARDNSTATTLFIPWTSHCIT
eukprot:scaffold117574_cov52-Attheya_sp.AAC.4